MGSNVAWKAMFVFFILWVLAILLPISEKKLEKKETSVSFGDMTVFVYWPDKIDIDIDLWMRCPGDEKPVGYSNRGGKVCNLQRDDLGNSNDSTDRNFEMVSTRGLPTGEYMVNLHYFKNREEGEKNPEIPVLVVVSTRATGTDKDTGGMREIITRKAVLRVEDEEITVVRFVITQEGELDPASVNDFHEELRTWQSPIR